MDTQPSTYKQFCLTRQQTHTHRRQIHTAIFSQPDPDNLDSDDYDLTQHSFKKDHKMRTILTAQDKKDWAVNIASTIIRDRINRGTKCQ